MSDQVEYLSLASGEPHTYDQPTWSTYKKLVHRVLSLIVISLVSHQVAIVISSWGGRSFKDPNKVSSYLTPIIHPKYSTS
jgi:hypothetical protein